MPDQPTREFLKSVAKNGSWPYVPGNAPSTEATVLCALACRDDVSLATQSLQYLLSLRNADGGWSSGEDLGDSDWNTGLALFGIVRLSADLKGRKKLSDDLAEKANVVYKDALSKLTALRADVMSDAARTVLTAVSGPDFDYPRGWPWEENTWHWIEPTSYSLLAIKSGALVNEKPYHQAIDEAEKFLYSKTCKGGGWNWGQVHAFGFDFEALPRSTAYAAMALQDKPNEEKVQQALSVLRNGTQQSKRGADDSLAAHALTILARDTFGDDVKNDADSLRKRFSENPPLTVNLASIALAVMALELPDKGNPFKFTGGAGS